MIFRYHSHSLNDFIETRRLASPQYLDECKVLMMGILRGVDYIHRRGVEEV